MPEAYENASHLQIPYHKHSIHVVLYPTLGGVLEITNVRVPRFEINQPFEQRTAKTGLKSKCTYN